MMHGLRKSMSFGRHWKGGSEDLHSIGEEESAGGDQQRSPYDTLVIQGRTRYPSDQAQGPVPVPSDIRIARALLNRSSSDGNAPSESSHVQSSLFDRSELFAGRYNHVAREHSLSELGGSPERNVGPRSSDENTKRHTWRWIHHRLSRKSSQTNLPSSHSRAGPRWHSLDDMYRLGGMSILHLPPRYSYSPLAIPTCLAATANYLVQHGRDSPGIFRISGQITIVNALYDYYVSKMNYEDDMAGQVEMTVGCTELPDTIEASAHDVASAFKRFLWDLPGGIIGSLALFRTLKEIENLPQTPRRTGVDEQPMRPRLVALALLSLSSRRRFALISSVFGLLAFLKQDDDSRTSRSPSHRWGPESMSSKALGVVFAPILLGNLTEGIESNASPTTSKRGLLPHRKTPRRAAKTERSPEIQVSLGRTASAAGIIDFLLVNWENIVKEIRLLRANHRQASTSRLCSLAKSASQPAMGLHDRHSCGVAHSFALRTGSNPNSVQNGASLHDDLFQYSTSGANNPGRIGCQPNTQSRGSSHPDDEETPLLQSQVASGAMRLSESSETSQTWWERGTSGGQDDSVVLSHDLRATLSRPENESLVNLEPRTTSESTQVITVGRRQDATESSGLSNPFFEDSEHSLDKGGLQAEEDYAVPNNDVRGTPTYYLGNGVDGARSAQGLGDISNMRPGAVQHGNTFRGIVSYGLSPGRPKRKSSSLIPRPVGRVGNNRSEKGADGPSRTMLNEVSDSYSRITTPKGAGDSAQGSSHGEAASMQESGIPSSAGPHLSAHRGQIAALPLIPEPTTARHMHFKTPSTEHGHGSEHQDELMLENSRSAKVGTLFAEIRRLKMELDMKNDDITQLRHELDAMRRFKDAGTLSEKLRERERELRFWMHRAQWAEKSLFRKGGSDAV